MYGTYQRLGLPVSASNLAVIRAASQKLKPGARSPREYRTFRHNYYREMLKYHGQAGRI